MIRMDKRGQLSVEYLLLVLIILIILGTVTIPLIGNSIDASMDVSMVSDAKTAVESISSAADIVYSNGPGSRRTMDIYIPQGTNLNTANNIVGMNITYSQGTKFVNSTVNYRLNNATTAVSKGWYRVTVNWVIGRNYLDVALTQI